MTGRVYFDNNRILERSGVGIAKAEQEPDAPRFADMLPAMGTEPRLKILSLLAKPKNEDLVMMRRDSRFLWYTANTEALKDLLGFLYAECCTRNKAISPECVIEMCK